MNRAKLTMAAALAALAVTPGAAQAQDLPDPVCTPQGICVSGHEEAVNDLRATVNQTVASAVALAVNTVTTVDNTAAAVGSGVVGGAIDDVEGVSGACAPSTAICVSGVGGTVQNAEAAACATGGIAVPTAQRYAGLCIIGPPDDED